MNVELLAPAGSFDSMKAAYAAGADAVYIGGSRFGARAFADNPDEEMLKRAIDHAHLRDKKLYMTVNTLLKEEEMDQLYDYLLPFYREGLDAVIVQDMGVFTYIRDTFPGLDLHASTQMTVTGVYGAELLKELGASRIVTARELSLDEIRLIRDHVDIEIESFVHGALCFCYSGQCLLSSVVGGRSGNRGRCAQPCRLPYELYDNRGRISDNREEYLLSPKDMCTLSLIPDMIEAGIDSFKVEGRMKRPEYTAGVTRVYRKYIDRYLEYGRKDFRVNREDENQLMDLYNRGGSSAGYYQKHNGKDMMSLSRPNHWGTKVAESVSSGREYRWQALDELSPGDVLEIRKGKKCSEAVFASSAHKNDRFRLKDPAMMPSKGGVLYRTKNSKLLEALEKQYLITPDRVKINGKLILFPGKSAILELYGRGAAVSVTGETVQEASKRPVTREEAEKQIRKLGQSDFVLEQLDISMSDHVFITMQALNELRRNAAAKLQVQMLERFRRKAPEPLPKPDIPVNDMPSQAVIFTVSVDTGDQLVSACSVSEVKRIYLNSIFFSGREDFFRNSRKNIEFCHQHGKECYYIFPWIFRMEKGNYLKDPSEVREILEAYDGVLIKSLEEYVLLKKMDYSKVIGTDHNLYIWNRRASGFWRERGILLETLPMELNDRELRQTDHEGREMIIYGRIPLMISAQCFQMNTSGCTKTKKVLWLKDRKNKTFPVKNDCSFCYNIILNEAPAELAGNAGEVMRLKPCSVRLSFTTENAEETSEILDHYILAFSSDQAANPYHEAFTRGHFKRGVE